MKHIRILRAIVAFGVLALIFAATYNHVSAPTYCSLCPIGFLQTALAQRAIPWDMIPGVLVVIALVFCLGHFFCSWLCPTGALKNLFGGKHYRGRLSRKGKITPGVENRSLWPQAIVFITLLVLSFVVKFPVFCIICPVGIVLGFLFALSKLIITSTFAWELIALPLLLAAEIFLLKDWCSSICPIGFFFTCMAKLRSKCGFAIGPKSATDTCLSTKGCSVCRRTCPEDINAGNAAVEDLENCTLCLECKSKCPTKSISYGVVRSKTKE